MTAQVEMMQTVATLQGKISEFDRIHGEFMKNFRALVPLEKIQNLDQDTNTGK